MSMPTSENEILASEIFSCSVDNKKSMEIAQRLSKILKKQVYLSFNVSLSADFMYREIENRLIIEIKEYPENF